MTLLRRILPLVVMLGCLRIPAISHGAQAEETRAGGARWVEAHPAAPGEGGRERPPLIEITRAGGARWVEAHPAAPGEGGRERPPLIENWWSWDYGPGKAHRYPPFGFALINFLIFAYVLHRLVGKSFREFLRNRHLSVRKALDEAAQMSKKAGEQLERYRERIARIDADVADLLSTVRREAEAERARIIAAAEAQAEEMRRDAEAQIEAEIARARSELKIAVAQAAVAAAEALLKARMQEADYKRLQDEYIARLDHEKALARPAQGGRV